MSRLSELARRGRKAMRMPPAALAQRLAHEAARRLRRPQDYVRPALLNDRALLRAARAPSIDALWESRRRSPFFLDARAQTARAFLERFPDALAAIVREADRRVLHQFDLLGSGLVTLPRKLPWRTDFKTGREWAPHYCHAIEYAELDRPTDVKVPWELSRCQHFTALGQAYWLTGDDRYAQEFVAEVSDWIADNPYAYTVNWSCAMDVALRAISWIWGFHFLADAPACAAAGFRRELLTSLFLHGDFVHRNLERGDINGNHYLTDGVGLVFLGSFFHDTAQGQQWLQTGRSIVVEEMFNQVTADGVDFEQSTAYHRLVLEGFLTSYLLLERAGMPVPIDARNRLERMCAFVAAYTKPNGRTPLVGDADDGRIQQLGTQPINDHRYLLSTAASIFERGDFKTAACRFWEESFWLLGTDGMNRFDRLNGALVADMSQAFPEGGFYVMRGGGSHVFVDCGEVGMRGRGGHGHNDVLSFELFMNGLNVITDCGAYVYTASPEWRNRFRSTASHNVVQVDDEELNRFVSPAHLWSLHFDARPVDVAWRCAADVDYLAASHTGYERLPQPVRCRREMILDRRNGSLVLRDTLESAGRHHYCVRFHFDPAVRLAVRDEGIEASGNGRSVWLQPHRALEAHLEDAWVSPTYGVKHPTTRAVFRLEADGRLELTWVFSAHPLNPSDRAAYVAALFERAAGGSAGVH
jgi:hypothetical protein